MKTCHVAAVAVLLAAALLLPGCRSTTRAREVKLSGFLKDYAQLKLNSGDGALYTYADPEVDFTKYDKIMFEPVVICAAPDSDLGKAPKKDLQALVDYMQAKTLQEVGKSFTVVKDPGPGVMLVRSALTDVGTKHVVLATASSVTPVGIALQSIEMLAMGTTLAAGDASIEVEILDSVTRRRLAAAVDRRVGTPIPDSRAFDKWGHTKDALDYWIERLAMNLTKRHTGLPVQAPPPDAPALTDPAARK